MLEYLHIQNLALIEDMELDFGPGMNALTGETGAGKSFILKALGFLLGDRLRPDMVRAGSERAHVEALFSGAGPDGGDLILKRELLASGRSRFYVNDEMKPQEYAKELREKLIAYTSQHGQQKLLQPAFQNQLMEQIIGEPELLKKRDSLKAKLEEKLAERKKIEARQAQLIEMRDLLELRQQEIDKVKPQENEDIELEDVRARARRAEEAGKDYETALNMLYGDGDTPGLLDMAAGFHRLLERMSESDAGLTPSAEAVNSFIQELHHLSGTLRHPPVPDDMPADLDAVEERLFELSQLKRRMHRTLPQILALRSEIEEKINFLDACALDIKKIDHDMDALAAELKAVTEELRPKRRAACEAFAGKLEDQLRGLGFSEGVRVIPEYVSTELWPGVMDEKIRILWAPNPGQAPQPLDRIASGGELSRLRLCMLMRREINFLILDEPTNHLDIASREWIEDALSDYTQALLFVSHDRYFIEKFATRIWLLENGTITDYRGTYEQFREYRARQTALQQTVKAVEREKKPRPKRAPNTARQRERTERDIEKLEAQLAALDAESEANATDYQKLMELDAQKQTLNTQLEALYAAWEALCD